MTSELRPAVEVWWKADTAFGAACLGDGRGDQAAAAVIEADREAVRAEQAAEVERLKKLIEATSAHFLRLNTDHPIMWEGAIDAAMEAVCLEVERQAAELAKFKVLAETLAGALDVMQSYGCPVCNGDCGSANPPVMSCPMSQSCEALRQYKEATNV